MLARVSRPRRARARAALACAALALLALALARAARRPATRARVVARDDDATTKIERSSVARTR